MNDVNKFSLEILFRAKEKFNGHLGAMAAYLRVSKVELKKRLEALRIEVKE